MGHLARQVAIALALDGRAEPIFFSMSLAMPAVLDLGMRGEYCPSYHREVMPRPLWDRYLADRIRALVAETGAHVFVFDGVAPYRGLLRARTALPDVAFVWVRRPLWRPGAQARSLNARRFFDLVIEPGDLAVAADRGQTARLTDALRISPVTLIEHVERLPREEAAKQLGLDPSRLTALAALRGDPAADDSPAAAAVRGLLANPECQIALPRRPIVMDQPSATRSGAQPIVFLPTVFPLARYLSAFDMAVSEAGYNSVHELLFAGIPSTLVPTGAAVTDDQDTRAGWAAGQGLAVYAEENDAAITSAVRQLIDPAVRADLARRCASLPAPRGSAEAATALIKLGMQFRQHRLELRERWDLGALLVQTMIERMLGRRLRTAARAALGRSPERGPRSRLRVQFADQLKPGGGDGDLWPLLFTEHVSYADLASGSPIEHLLAGSGEGYRVERERIARRYYAVQR
jgi:hypothetical protein